MKRFFWLLILINLGLLAYFNIGYILPGKPEIKLTEISPDKIQLLSQAEIDALPKKQAAIPLISSPSLEAQTKTACYEWGIFSAGNIARAQSALAAVALSATVKEETPQQAKRYWVYRPPLKTAQEAQAKIAEFKALGVDELVIVQEQKWKNAISFGIFEDEQLAIKLLNELKAKGVKNVVKALRNQGNGHASLLFTNLTEANATELKKLIPEFTETALKEVSCN